MKDLIANTMAGWNTLALERPYRAMEWCDLQIMPAPFREGCQNMLDQQWSHKLPFLQPQSPAQLACERLDAIINEVALMDDTPLEVTDLCAGGGGPTPIFERLINAKRFSRGQSPVDFVLGDLYPHINAWKEHAKKSDHLSYIAEPVDAAEAPDKELATADTSRRSSSAAGNQEASSRPTPASPKRTFRLFNLSFHHFTDSQCKQVLRSTCSTASGVAIIELQDRRRGTLLLFALNFVLVLLLTPFWFSPFPRGPKTRHNVQQLLLTYSGILPFILWWDGLASCMRTREFDEVMQLAQQALQSPTAPAVEAITVAGTDGARRCQLTSEWEFRAYRQMHTFPFGYLNMIVGVRVPPPY
ncbi:hypothetical protein BDV95DRAFT_257728 [Massariosphaeria phaeospora]|uniref:S-adenosyl-L-methionine-dependent methyltransferase n=1 Tax=Massariosphaeria phaeospora TaxID=100035 RepID=A0A7C8I2P7_9PLEO|nr:hypothetical protein BDV95DRAFT_257728 [Massariosphaeria phaeospora]